MDPHSLNVLSAYLCEIYSNEILMFRLRQRRKGCEYHEALPFLEQNGYVRENGIHEL
jgi:hypothetical protein